MAQDYATFPDEPFLSRKQKGIGKGIPKRVFQHEILRSRFAAAGITSLTSILTNDQLQQCADIYTNNGIVRSLVDKSVFYINPERTDFTIEANQELTEGATDQELNDLNQSITDDTLLVNDQPARIKELRQKTIRCNKRVKLHDRLEKFLTSCLVLGRNGLEIVRFPKSPEWPMFGEPRALLHLNSRKIEDVQMNTVTHEFEGFFYNTSNIINPIKFIPSSSLISGFHNDNNLYENTNYSGVSALWPILTVAQADGVINDEDIPEATRNLGHKFGLIYAGTNDDSKIAEIEEKLQDKTWLVHGIEGLTADVHDLARDLMELPNVRLSDAKYMTTCMSVPLFLMFEDTATFATANQVMQVWKAGMLKRYRTWLQGILEEHWYDVILADHFNIELKDVISLPIKIKPIFQDINFETRKEIIEGDKMLHDMNVMNEMDVAKDIDRKDIAQRLEEEESEIDRQKEQAVQEALGQMRLMQAQQQRFPPQTQQATAAASAPLSKSKRKTKTKK